MKKILFLTVVISILLFTACEPPKGEPTDYANVCTKASDGKTIETSGLLDPGTSVYCSSTSGRMECGFKLKKDEKDEKGFSADIAIASGANGMDKLERGYQKDSIVIRNNEGNNIDLSKEVKITGKVTFSDNPTYSSPVCYVKVYKIEQ